MIRLSEIARRVYPIAGAKITRNFYRKTSRCLGVQFAQ